MCAVSDRGITAHTIDGLELSASYQLPGSTNYDYWDCWDCGGLDGAVEAEGE